MEVWVNSPAWQRSGYGPDLDQAAKDVSLCEGRVKRDWLSQRGAALHSVRAEAAYGEGKTLAYEERPFYRHGRSGGGDDLIPGLKRDDGYQNRRRLEDPEDVTLTRTASRHHQHEEDTTEFRGQFRKDLHQQEDSDTVEQQRKDNGNRKTELPTRGPQHTSSQSRGGIHNANYIHIQSQPQRDVTRDGVNTGFSPEHWGQSPGSAFETMQTASQEKKGGFHHTPASISVIRSSGSLTGNLYKQNDLEESDDEAEYEFDGEEELEGEYHLEEDHPEYSWHREYDGGARGLETSSSAVDWKRPDIHLFKTSSYKGSVTSERSSRLDPHTYQSYAAGLLYSSGRSEKFLKLQKHFAILERIAELDKTSSAHPLTSPDERNSKWNELNSSGFPSGQDFPSKEELQELYTELKEAKKNKEFFCEIDKTEQLQWRPQKDLGLKKRERSLRDRVRLYRNLVEEGKTTATKLSASTPDKYEQIKRSVSFGALYEKFGSSSVSQHEKKPPEVSPGRPFHEHKEPTGVDQRRQTHEDSATELTGLHSGDHEREVNQQRLKESKAAFSLESERKGGRDKYNKHESSSDLKSDGCRCSSPQLSDGGGKQQCISSKAYSDEHSKIDRRKETKPEGVYFKQESHFKLGEPPSSYTHDVSYSDQKFDIKSSKELSPVRDPPQESRSHNSQETSPQRYNDANRKETTDTSRFRPETASSRQPATKPERSAHEITQGTRSTKNAEDSVGSNPREPQSNSKDWSGHTNPKESKPAAREMSYLQLMDSAARKSRQRAIHGTHLDPPRNEYEVYVEEVKRMTKDKVDTNNLHIRSVSAPHSALKLPAFGTLPRSQSSKESFFGAEEPSGSPDVAGTAKKGGEKVEDSLEVVVDSATRPGPGLLVKSGPAHPISSDEVTTPPLPTVRQAISSSVKRDRDIFSTTGSRTRFTKDSAYDPADSSDTTDSEIRPVRQRYSDMPDIIQIERHRDRSRKNVPKHTDTQTRANDTETHNARIQKLDTRNDKPQNPDNLLARPQNPNKPDPVDASRATFPQCTDAKAEGKPSNSIFSESQSVAPHSAELRHSNPHGKGPAVFRVTDLRNLAANNEFSPSHLSWMKKSPAGRNDTGFGHRAGQQRAQTPEPYRSTISQKSTPHFDPYSRSEREPRRYGSSVPETKTYPLTEPVAPSYRQATVPSETSVSVSTMEKKVPPAVPPKTPSLLDISPTPSQSRPSFSAKTKATGSGARPEESTKRANIVFADPLLPTKGAQRWTDFPHSNDTGTESGGITDTSVKRAEVVFTSAPAQSKESPRPANFTHRRTGRESEHGVTSAIRRPGDGNDCRSPSPDQPPGQLRKWTAVADIYRDVEKSWSPTREARPFPPDNNSSISSTDTFIVKETDEEDSQQEDMESSGASVSHLREIFERRQKVNKSKSEPDLSVDSCDEPTRPRSAKSQTSLHSSEREDGSRLSHRSGVPRTVSGDLADLRHRYGDSRVPEIGPGTRAEQTSPTNVALKAWVEYTGRSRYDPYLPPEDILKEVSAAATGRKLDVPRKTHHRPSNVSKMTLEYFDQIGSEWQQSSARGSIRRRPQPETSEQQPPVEQQNAAFDTLSQPGLPPNDRRNLSHQYVNEQTALNTSYAQTDDLKLRQSQWASQFAGGSYHRRHQPDWTASYQSTGTDHGNITGRERPRSSEGTGDQRPAVSNAPKPAPRPRSQPPSTRPRSYPPSSHNPPQTDSARTPSRRNFPSQDPRPSYSGDDPQLRRGPEEETPRPRTAARHVPPEPSRLPPVSPRSRQRMAPSQAPALQHRHSRSSDSEQSSGDYGAVYCVSTGAVWYGVEAEEATEPPVPSLPHSSQINPSNPAARQLFLQPPQQGGGSSTSPPFPTRRNPPYPSATLGRNTSVGTAPAPPTRGVGASGARTLPRARTSTPHGSSLSAVEQLGVQSPSAGLGSAASAGLGASNPIPSARAFRHQTTDARRPPPEPVDPEKERRRREEEEAYRKKRLEELYEEERQKKIRKDEADAEARRHHDFFTSAQKSPISPNRFDDASASLSPSTPGSLGTLERKEQQLSIPPERRRGFQIQGKARALYNFNAQNPRELSFRKNDIIYLLRQVDKNWFEGERHGVVGIFPTNYVEVVTSIEAARAAAMQAEGQGRAKYTFNAQSSVELSLRKGEFVVLLRRVDDNWYEGRIGNRQGIFPVSYIEITREPSTPLITPAPSVITTPMTGTPEMLSPVSCDAAPTPPPQPSPSAFASHRSPTAPYGYRQPHQQTFFGSGSAPLLAPASSVSRQNISLSRQDQDFSSPRSPHSNHKSPTSNSRSPISPGGKLGSPGQGKKGSPVQPQALGPSSSLQVDIHAKAKPYTNGQAKPNRVADDDLAVTRYRALYAYRPQNEDELELREGDEVFVMEKCDDGWFVGTSAATGCFGTFPGNYVQKIYCAYYVGS